MEHLLQSAQETVIGWGLSDWLAVFVVRLFVVFVVVVFSILADYVAKHYVLRTISYLARKTSSKWDDVLLQEKVFQRLAHFAPALVVFLSAPLVFAAEPALEELLKRIAAAYMIVLACLVINALLNAGVALYRTREISIERPITAYIQVLKIAVYLVSGIFVLAMLFDRSPWALLSGLGALTAVLMLVFKDSILGFVSSIQVAANDMVRVGDWIEMPKYGADGDVIEITLNTVKVQNWDKTISTIPTYALISDTFKNWRGMSESGGRRIKRAIHIDMNTIRFCSEEDLQRFSRFEFLSDYLDKKGKEIRAYNEEHGVDQDVVVNGRRQTNIGVFRAYVEAYLRNHPKIHLGMTFLVRHLAPTENGLPIEIYVFSNDQVWANYEGIQADIFDHILAVIPEFGLRVFQSPSGEDIRRLARA